MKVLWLSTVRYSTTEMSCSGTWIVAMLNALVEYCPDIEVANVIFDDVYLSEDVNGIKQWTLPFRERDFRLKEIVSSYVPDIIHVWGTESSWCSVDFGRLFPNIPVLLDMQGVMSSISKAIRADLSFAEYIKCIGIKEILKPSISLPFVRREFERKAVEEYNAIKKFQYISVQSDWVEGYITSINPECRIYHTKIALRTPYYKSKKWSAELCSKHTLFATSTLGLPNKGAHTLIRAFGIVHSRYPDSKLFFGGYHQIGLRRTGYQRFVESMIIKYGLMNDVSYVGSLDTNAMIQQCLNASVFVNPSFVESYSLIVAESTYLGVPTVAANAGAMGELGGDNSILYFPPGDYVMCAHQIMKIFQNQDKAVALSHRAINYAENRNSLQSAAITQQNIYKSVINEE